MNKWLRLPADERLLVIQGGLLQITIRLGLKVLPLKTLLHLLHWSAVTFQSPTPASEEFGAQVVRIAAGIARRLPGDRPCLGQALTVQWFYLRNHLPVDLVVGVAKSPSGQLVAHAWVESCGMVVIGGPERELEAYTRFPALESKLR